MTSIELTIDVPVRAVTAHQDWPHPVLGFGDTARIRAVTREQRGGIVTDAEVRWLVSGHGVRLVSAGGREAVIVGVGSGVVTVVAESEDARAEIPVEAIRPFITFTQKRLVLDGLEVGVALQTRVNESRRGPILGAQLRHTVLDTSVAVVGTVSTAGDTYMLEVLPRGPGATSLTTTWMGASDVAQIEVWDTARIAFTTGRDGKFEVYTMRPNGTDLRNVTNHPANDYAASWSPDRRRLVFTSDRDGNPNIYIVNLDGTGVRRLTDHPASDDWAAWSPDGSRIAFSSDRSGMRAVYVMNVDGTGVTKLTSGSFDAAVADRPKWSPDGKRIVFQSARNGNFDIYSIAADGTGSPIQITRDPRHEEAPDWSPDGLRIAFQLVEWGADCISGICRIALINSDGSGLRVLSQPGPGSQMHPSWSRDGNRLAYTNLERGNFDIYTVTVDSSQRYRLTTDPGVDGAPAWRQ